MTAHTPGPWEVSTGPGRKEILTDRGLFAVAVLYSGRNDSANARLIAAAPELLASLKVLIDAVDEFWMTENPGAVDAAEAAIAKAEGR